MSNDKKGSFLDPKTLMAIVSCFAILILWQMYQKNKYPEYYAQQGQKQESKKEIGDTEKKTAQLSEPVSELKASDIEEAKSTLPEKETVTSFSGSKFSGQISSRGMGLKNVEIHAYKTRDEKPIIISENSMTPLFATGYGDSWKPLNFRIEKLSETKFRGEANRGPLKIIKEITIRPDEYTLDVEMKIEGATSPVTSLFNEKIAVQESSIPFAINYDQSTFFVNYGTKTDRLPLATDDENEAYEKVGVLSLDSHYFTRTVIDNSKILPTAKFNFQGEESLAIGRLNYESPNSELFTVSQLLYIGPKERDTLLAVDERLDDVVNFGMFSFLGHPILDLLKWFYSVTSNWGVAIILLTLVVRIILVPFNVMSFKSMKKMKDIQPQLKALKEKHKDDPQLMNQESMRIMKESGANPFGSCLPMLLQFPIFIALFSVLGNSIELYRAPFFLWIDDLSLRDPYFVLPVLMFITMTLQQQLTPTAADPSQKKMMMFVTVIFSAFLIMYPSGLALYIFVGSLFSIIQQAILLREKKPEDVSVKTTLRSID